MTFKFSSDTANYAYYDVAVILNQQPTIYHLEKTNPQLRKLSFVEWSNFPLFNVQVDSKATVKIRIHFGNLTQPFIGRLQKSVSSSFINSLAFGENITYQKEKMEFLASNFKRCLKILVVFMDSSTTEPAKKLKRLQTIDVSITILLKMCQELLI